MAMISILGLYQIDDTIFDLFELPEEVETDRETFINNIILECAELEILYPDPAIMKNAIGLWTYAEMPSWTRYARALQAEYNPLWNVDASITETIEHDRTRETNAERLQTNNLSANESLSGDRSGSDENTRTDNTTQKTTEHSTGSDNDTDTLSSTAFNVATWRQRDKNESAASLTRDNDVTVKNTGTVTDAKQWSEDIADTTTRTDTGTIRNDDDTTETDSGTEEHTITRTGNIGVTSSQQLIKQEIELAENNLVYYITNSFKRRFCLLVY